MSWWPQPRGALMVDTRTEAHRRAQGELRAVGLPRSADLAGGVEARLAASLSMAEGPGGVRA